ncbi:MAG: penicillin acylase family protein, partial [Lutibacter sp.]|nr:penicillin acylase family protein [Lutibacter sp.]
MKPKENFTIVLEKMMMCFLAFLLFVSVAEAEIDPENITIVRDTFGVPHIFAPTDAEAAYGLAYAHAEDDFDNIQRGVLAGQGRLGEVEGKDGVLFDFGLRFLKIDSLVDARFELDLSTEYRAVLDGYVQGLNAFAEAHPKEKLHKKLFPVVSQDLVKSYTLSLSLMAGLGMALKAVNENRIQEFFGANEFSSGSNAFAVAPERMVDGNTYLLINSHQPIEGRFAWYEAHIQSDE